MSKGFPWNRKGDGAEGGRGERGRRTDRQDECTACGWMERPRASPLLPQLICVNNDDDDNDDDDGDDERCDCYNGHVSLLKRSMLKLVLAYNVNFF